jgi:hypothetical protein
VRLREAIEERLQPQLPGAVVAEQTPVPDITPYHLAPTYVCQEASVRRAEKVCQRVPGRVHRSPTRAVISVDYTAKGIPQHVHIDQVMLKPGEVRSMDLAERLSGIGSNGPIDDAGVDISYNGAPGSVLAKLTSVDQSGDYSFDMPIKDPLSGAPYRVSGSYPWRLDSGYTTVLHLKNTLAKDVYAGVQFRFNGGQYTPARVHLAPFQTVALDLAEIRSRQKVDLDGNIFPADAVSGRIAWHEEEPGSLIGRAEVVQIAWVSPVASVAMAHVRVATKL